MSLISLHVCCKHMPNLYLMLATSTYIQCMRGSRKFCQSCPDNVICLFCFLVVIDFIEGRTNFSKSAHIQPPVTLSHCSWKGPHVKCIYSHLHAHNIYLSQHLVQENDPSSPDPLPHCWVTTAAICSESVILRLISRHLLSSFVM